MTDMKHSFHHVFFARHSRPHHLVLQSGADDVTPLEVSLLETVHLECLLRRKGGGEERGGVKCLSLSLDAVRHVPTDMTRKMLADLH